MRILMVTNNYTPYSGGVVSSLNAFIPALQAAGHQVLLVAPQFLVHHDDPSWVKRVPSLIRFRWRTNRMAVVLRMKHFLKTVMRDFKPEVVHVHHPFMLGEAARAVAYEQGVRVVFTYHTLYESYAHYLPLPQVLVKKVIASRVQKFCASVDAVIAPSQEVQDMIEKHTAAKMVVIPSPLQEVFLQQLSPQKRTNDRLVLLAVGRFVPEKNMHAVLELFSRLPRARFRLVMIGYGSLYDELQKRAYDHYGFSCQEVEFVYKPEKQVLARWYVNADIFLFTSQTDTQGLVLVEAMAGGLPVLALPGAGQKGIVCDGKNGFICNSLDVMYEKLLLLADNQELLKILSQGAKQTSKKYIPDIVGQELIFLYKQLTK